MHESHSDALVLFGAKGDLAFKKIFPALYAVVRRGHLDVPVIAVARGDWISAHRQIFLQVHLRCLGGQLFAEEREERGNCITIVLTGSGNAPIGKEPFLKALFQPSHEPQSVTAFNFHLVSE
jgi:hypothetical protein